MPHSIKIDEAEEHLFVLRNLAYAAKEYAQRHDLTVNPGLGTLSEHDTYFAQITTLVGDRLLNLAITTRLAYDIARDDCEEYGPSMWDSEAMQEHLNGHLSISDTRPSIREVCNKIIHAKSISLDRISRDGGKTEEWSGRVYLAGDKGKTSWQCEFSIPPLCDAIDYFLVRASENIDWFDLYDLH